MVIMEKKPGYKQTEVGMIPEDWEVKKLSMITQFTNGKAHEQFIDDKGDYIVVNSKFISTEGKIVKYSKENLSPLFIDEVVMVMSDIPNGKALAKCFFVRENGKYTLNQRICSLRPYDADSQYLFYKLNRNQYFLNFDSGVGQTNLKRGEILDCPIALPPSKTEQHAIATALSDVDALITSLDKLIAKKRDIKQATMQQLLTGKTRLPGFCKGLKPTYKQTEVGVIPEDWKIVKLGEIADVKTGPFGSALHEKDYVNDGTPIITVEHLSEQGVVYVNLPMVSDSDRKRLKAYILLKGDIVFSRVGSVDRNSLIKEEESGWLFSGRLLRIRVKTLDICSSFLSYYFNQESTKQRVRAVAVGQTMASLNTQILKNVDIAFPPTTPEQTAIATILSDMDAEIAALEQRRDKTRILKQGMMQELITGKTRLI
jgi:type I restriction enzyme, S subunit